MLVACVSLGKECVFCNNKMILLKLQLRKINSWNTALGEANSFPEKTFPNKKTNEQPDVNGSDKCPGREHTGPIPSLCTSHLAHGAEPLHGWPVSSPQFLLLFKLQSIQTLLRCYYYTDTAVLC